MSISKTVARPALSVIGVLLVSFPLFAGAAMTECAAKVSPKLTAVQMKKMAKISMDAALLTATELVGKSKLNKVMSKELEVEDGCLLYSFDLQLHSSEGVEEVAIDAISGKVLSQKHETPAAEKEEKMADDKTASKKLK